MAKKFLKIFLILTLIFSLTACATSEYTYEESGDGVIVSEYTGSDANLVIPESYNGNDVVEISYQTFAFNIYIENVQLPAKLIKIDGCAFWYCTSLKMIYVPASVKVIEAYSFYNCPNISTVCFEAREANVNISIEEGNDDFNNASHLYGVSLAAYAQMIN